MAKDKQHYLPASAIGQFSSARVVPLRESRVWVLRRKPLTPIKSRAASVGYESNLYDTTEAKWDIDAYWSSSENKVHPAVDVLLGNGPEKYEVDPWVHLANYLASLFARSPDWQAQLQARFAAAGLTRLPSTKPFYGKDNVNVTRVMENQRVSAAILRARWTFIRSDETELILNDRGITAMSNSHWRSYGYVFPLRPNFAAMLGTGPYPKTIQWKDGRWWIEIPTWTINQHQAHELNLATWRQARREVYGPTYDEMKLLSDTTAKGAAPAAEVMDIHDGATFLGLNPRDRMEDETLMMRLIGGIKKPDDEKNPPILKI